MEIHGIKETAPNMQAQPNTMAPSQSQQKTIIVKLSDMQIIQNKMFSYQTRLKAFENLQNILAKRDEDLAYYKRQVRHFEALYNEELQKNKALDANYNIRQNGLSEAQRSPQHIYQLSQQREGHSPSQIVSSPQVALSPQYIGKSPQVLTAPQQLHDQQQFVPHQIGQQQMTQHFEMKHEQQFQQQQYDTSPLQDNNEIMLSLGLEGNQHFSGTDFLQMINTDWWGTNTNLAPCGDIIFHEPDMDGEEVQSMKSIQNVISSSVQSMTTDTNKTAKHPLHSSSPMAQPVASEVTVSSTIFRNLLQNVFRLQKSLRDVASIKGTSQTKLDYENVIASLKSQLGDMEARYEKMVEAMKSLTHGDYSNIGKVLADYENKIAKLQQILVLKESLHLVYTQGGPKTTEQNVSHEINDEEKRQSEIVNISDMLQNTSLNEHNGDYEEKQQEEVLEAARLANEIKAHKKELRTLQDQIMTLKQEEAGRSSDVEKQTTIHNQLVYNCQDQEAKLKRISKDMAKKKANTDSRIVDLKSEHDDTIKDLQHKHNVEVSTITNQHQSVIGQKDQQQQQLMQYFEGRLAKQQVGASTVHHKQHLPRNVTQDGPQSCRSIRSEEARSVEREASCAGLQCSRCDSLLLDKRAYDIHMRRCTDD